MTQINQIKVGDFVSLKGEDGEWMIESITPSSNREQEMVFYKHETGDYIQLELKSALEKIDSVVRRGQ